MESNWYQDAFARGTTVIVDNDPSQVATVRYADYNDPRKPPVAYELKWGGQHLRVTASRVTEYTPEDQAYDAYCDEMAEMCECEIDWRCHLHAGLPTHLETRYSELDLDPRERSDYVGF